MIPAVISDAATRRNRAAGSRISIAAAATPKTTLNCRMARI